MTKGASFQQFFAGTFQEFAGIPRDGILCLGVAGFLSGAIDLIVWSNGSDLSYIGYVLIGIIL